MPLLELFHHFKIYLCIRCLKDFIFTRDDETRDPTRSETFRKKHWNELLRSMQRIEYTIVQWLPI